MISCGSGTHSLVFRRGQGRAVKLFRKSMNSSPRARAEYDLALTFAAHNLVRVLAVNVTESWLEMEFMDGGTLAELVQRQGKLSECCIARAAADILAGLAVLHEHGFLHRDLKPANVMRDSRSGSCKLIDWIGAEEEQLSVLQGKPVGTPLFLAPEVVRKLWHMEQSDTWAMGCTVLNLSSGRLPWADADTMGRTNEFMAMWKTGNGHAPPFDAGACSASMAAFVQLCFEPDPLKRKTARSLCSTSALYFEVIADVVYGFLKTN